MFDNMIYNTQKDDEAYSSNKENKNVLQVNNEVVRGIVIRKIDNTAKQNRQ
jgi:hypothetical protein